MLKAIFIDYTGTIVEESGPDVREMVKRCCMNSDLTKPEEMIRYWWQLLKEFELNSSGADFKTEDEIVTQMLKRCEEKIHLNENLEELHELCRRFWMYAPAFEDVKDFFENCPVPVYIVTNIPVSYVETGMKDKGLHPAGIVSAELAGAYKPYREIFDKALEISGCRPEEVVHIGDSLTSDVEGALSAGIRPVWLDRRNAGASLPQGVRVSPSLTEVLEMLATERAEEI